MGRRRDSGETLIEILLTVVITGLTFTALIASLATAGNAGNAQRASVASDVVIRNYAEATKAATQQCVAGGAYTVAFVPPTGFTAIASPATTICPAVTATQVLQLTVTGPQGFHETMQIEVRTP